MKIQFKYTGPFEAPRKQTEGAAAIDLFNNTMDTILIAPNTSSKPISTGFFVEIPENHVGIVAIRSSLGFKYDVTLSNSIGVIDSDYRGEVMVKLFNHSPFNQYIKPGERIAQFMIVPVLKADYEQVEELSTKTQRGDGGFGSTGQI